MTTKRGPHTVEKVLIEVEEVSFGQVVIVVEFISKGWGGGRCGGWTTGPVTPYTLSVTIIGSSQRKL